MSNAFGGHSRRRGRKMMICMMCYRFHMAFSDTDRTRVSTRFVPIAEVVTDFTAFPAVSIALNTPLLGN